MAADKVSYELKGGANRFELAYDNAPVVITDSGFSTSDVRLIAILDASDEFVKRVGSSGTSTSSDAKDKS